ncbi:MAG: LysR family transcriptional regulator [Oscillospiraceae bacterium]|nr:LysR family transcriptional regulator [Clostridiales bacterium]MDR3895458.1 LysR family transcriptional regulator [Oscillospiraceae bacterium]
MTLKQILYVRAVSKAGSIGKAAEALFISQSSLSESIQNLEREYDMVLFERTSRGISLTRQGEEFLKDTQLLSNIYQDLDDKYKNRKSEREHFCVSSLHHVSGIDAFEHIVSQPKNQKYHLGYFEGNMDQVLQDVETNRSDVGVLFFTSDSRSTIIKACNRRNIFFQHMKYDLLHIYVHKTHPLAGRGSVTLAEIQQHPFISYEECHPSSARFTPTRRQWDPQQQIISVSDRAMAYSVLALGSAYVTGSGYLTQEDCRRSLVTAPITDLGQIEIGYICNPARALSELALEYIEWLKKITV